MILVRPIIYPERIDPEWGLSQFNSRLLNFLYSGKGISIEAVIPEEVPEFQLALGTPYTDVPHSPFVSSNSPAQQQQQQQQSSALYQRSKSQRQPKATKK